eukprot:CAMPEP_0194205254 /NCGR_PEP_ID=MMETSP0156-20130528/4568_1 /TAXON_ID=33649 /ORGANISM="Thalassionema nitzschioides, Strain L26-B" /LENGTH=1123 /DNA_ID=CAMNT_0038931477 /DNA_START=61 /DNA_END=3432 /DNA_ORIENTATION=+
MGKKNKRRNKNKASPAAVAEPEPTVEATPDQTVEVAEDINVESQQTVEANITTEESPTVTELSDIELEEESNVEQENQQPAATHAESLEETRDMIMEKADPEEDPNEADADLQEDTVAGAALGGLAPMSAQDTDAIISEEGLSVEENVIQEADSFFDGEEKFKEAGTESEEKEGMDEALAGAAVAVAAVMSEHDTDVMIPDEGKPTVEENTTEEADDEEEVPNEDNAESEEKALAGAAIAGAAVAGATIAGATMSAQDTNMIMPEEEESAVEETDFEPEKKAAAYAAVAAGAAAINAQDRNVMAPEEEDGELADVPPYEEPPAVRPGAFRVGGDDDMEDELVYKKECDDEGAEIVVIQPSQPSVEPAEELMTGEKIPAKRTMLADDAEEDKKHNRKYWLILFLVLLEVVILIIALAVWQPQKEANQTNIRGGLSSPGAVYDNNSMLCDGSDNFEYHTTMCNSNGDGFQELKRLCQNGIPKNEIKKDTSCPSERPRCMVCGEENDAPFATCVSRNVTNTSDICEYIEKSDCNAGSVDYEVIRNSCIGRNFFRRKEECMNGTLTTSELDLRKCGLTETSQSTATTCLDCPGINQVACADETMTCGDIWNFEPTISPRPTVTQPSHSPSIEPSSSPTDFTVTRCDAEDNFEYKITVCHSDGDRYQEVMGLCKDGIETESIESIVTCPAQRPHCVMCGDNTIAVCASSLDAVNECASGRSLDDPNVCVPGLFDYEWTSSRCMGALLQYENNTCINGVLVPGIFQGVYTACGLTTSDKKNSFCKGPSSLECPEQTSYGVCAARATSCKDIWTEPRPTPTLSPTNTATDEVHSTTSPLAVPPVSEPPIYTETPIMIYPSIAPTTAPIATASPVGPSGGMPLTISDYCSGGSIINQNLEVEQFLSSNNNGPIYVLEFLNFTTNTIVTPESYQSLLLSLGGGSKLVFSMKRISQFTVSLNPPLEWTHAYIMEYPNGGTDFYNLYMNSTQVSSMLSRRPQPYSIYMATKNSTGSELYPNLFSESTDNPQLLSFHGLHFANPKFVDEFDALTKAIKVQNGFRTQAWLDIGARCGTAVSINQFRIETILSLAAYGNLLVDPLWGEGSLLRGQGVTPDSFSGFADHHGIITNLYN